MKPEYYKILCDSCDRLLKDPEAGAYRISIPWLHIVREHSHFLQQYEYLFSKEPYLSKFGLFRLYARYFASWVLKLVQAMPTPQTGVIGSGTFPLSTDVLIVSHLINPAHLQLTKDFYFDELPLHLSSNGFRVVVVLINHTGRRFSKNEMPDSSINGYTKFILADSMGIDQELAWLQAARAESARLVKVAQQEQGIIGEIAKRAAVESFSGSARASYRLGRQISTLVQRLRPRAVLTTYEGHAWERTVFQQARSAYLGIRCIAYQHAALFKLQHGIRRSLGHLLDPDVILTSGEAARKQFLNSELGNGPRLEVFGSNRCALRDKSDSSTLSEQANLSKLCLVLLDAFEHEFMFMLDFVIKCASKLTDITFLLRLHPATQFEKLIKQNPQLQQMSSNIILSTDSLEKDALSATWVLYRGSTAVVSGVQHGALPVYLKAEGEMTSDPLYTLGPEREIVTSVDAFVEFVLTSLDKKNLNCRRALIAEHCQEIFSPLNFQVVADYLETLPNPRLV